jgi:hypothetical protein
MYTSFFAYFADDVSGNRSKSWNKHMNAYITHQNLPRKLLQHERHIHFVSTSQHASAAEQFAPIKAITEYITIRFCYYFKVLNIQYRDTRTAPLRVHDALTGKEVVIQLGILFGPSDNPMASEMCGHIGDKGNYPCRKCQVGGTRKEKEENPIYDALFSPQDNRSVEIVTRNIKEQLKVACLGNAKDVAALQTASGVKDAYAQVWIKKILMQFQEKKATGLQRADEITKDLLSWVEDDGSAMYSSFLSLKGASNCNKIACICHFNSLVCRFRPYQGHTHRTSPHDTPRSSKIHLAFLSHNMVRRRQENIFSSPTSNRYQCAQRACNTLEIHHAICRLSHWPPTQDAHADWCISRPQPPW